jgi:hypothetical protein
MSWKALGAVAATELVDARLQLHHAAQVVASAGATFLAPEPDDSHPNFGWVESLGALMGHTLPGADAQVGLRVADLTLLLVNNSGEVSDEFALDGKKLDDGYEWLASVTARAGAELPSAGITRAPYEIPNHSTGSGEVFSSKSRVEDFAELARWFANGHDTLVELATRVPGASDVRCWPHHFDLGTLAVLAKEPNGDLAKTIGIGLSPGDDGYVEPYWYVSPWPYPEPNALPSLESAGHWHTEGYTSAILTGSDLVAGSPENQSERLHAFLDAAVDVCRRILAD